MAVKKRNKVSAEFSMSSLTDIIFLLLIFFMLTSNFVQIQPFELPESDSKTVASTSIVVAIEKGGTYELNNKEVSLRSVEAAVRRELMHVENRKEATLTIVAEKGVPFRKVAKMMEIAGKLHMRAIIATQPKTTS